MTQSNRPVQIGERAGRVLAAELTRHSGPKSGLLVGALAGSPALTAAIDALLPWSARVRALLPRCESTSSGKAGGWPSAPRSSRRSARPIRPTS